MQSDPRQAENDAKAVGLWLTNQWEDELKLKNKIVQMAILTSKHSISFLKLLPKYSEQKRL